MSLVGTWMQTTALMWLTFELTGQSTWPAAIAAAQLLPTFFFGIWGGWAADRWPKRSLILATQAAFTLQAFGLAALAGAARPWWLLGLTAAGGLVQAVDMPARLAFVTELAGQDDLMNAVGLNSLLFNVARALGPALAGPLLATVGPGLCFLVNGVSYLAVLWALAQMDPEALVTAIQTGAPCGGSVLSGFNYLSRRPELGFQVLLATAVSLSAWPFLALLPGLASRTLHAGGGAYSWMLSGTGIGALAAALALARAGNPTRWRWIVSVGVAILTTGLVALASAGGTPAAAGCCAAVGFGLILLMVTGQSVVQLGADHQNRGRVMAVWAIVLSGAIPLGNLVAGHAADRWGERAVLRAQGLSCAAAAVALAFLLVGWQRARVVALDPGPS